MVEMQQIVPAHVRCAPTDSLSVYTQAKNIQQAHELTSTVVVHSCLGKHGVVLNLCFPDRRAVVADEDQLCCSKR